MICFRYRQQQSGLSFPFLGFGNFNLLETYYGQTVGKRLVGVRVVSEDGTAIWFLDAVIRNVLRIIDGIAVYLVGALFIWLSEDNQRSVIGSEIPSSCRRKSP